MMKLTSCLFACIGFSCVGSDGVERVTTSVGTNSLNITSITTSRSVENGEPVFEVHALDANGHEVATMRRRKGVISDLPRVPNADFDDTRGTEITVDVNGEHERIITRQEEIAQPLRMNHKSVEEFVLLPEVTAATRGAGLTFVGHPHDVGSITGERATYADSCSSGELRANGVYGKDCCRDKWGGATAYVEFINEGNHTVSDRFFGGGNTLICRTSSGSSNCSGTACTYGPCGSQPASFHGPYSSPQIYGGDLGDGNYCWAHNGAPNSNFGGIWGSCGYSGCINGTPTTGGSGSAAGYWD